MSNEYPPQHSYDNFPDFNEDAEVTAAIEANLRKLLEEIAHEQGTSLQEIEDKNTAIMQEIRTQHLEILIQIMLDIAEDEDCRAHVVLDEFEDTHPMDEHLGTSMHYILLEKKAKAMAVDDFLILIAQKNPDSENTPTIPLFLWSKEILRERGYTEYPKQEDSVFYLPTAHPKIAMVYSFPPGSDRPTRSFTPTNNTPKA